MEKQENGQILFEDIVSGVKEREAMDSTVLDWFYDSIVEQFDIVLSDSNKLIKKETLKKIYHRILEECPTFFKDNRNTAYLKLAHLYEIYRKKNGENQELYYVTDRLAPSTLEYNNVTTHFSKIKKEEIGKDDLIVFYNSNYIYESAQQEYIDALDYGEKLPSQNQNIKEAISILYAVIENLDDLDMIVERRSEEYYQKAQGFSLASLYCYINGNSFTIEERNAIGAELSQVQFDLLDNLKKKKSK